MRLIGFIAVLIMVCAAVAVFAWPENKSIPEKIERTPVKTETAVDENKQKDNIALVAPGEDKELALNEPEQQPADMQPGIKEDAYYAPKDGAPFGKVRPVPASTNKTVAAVHEAIQPATRDAKQLTVMAQPEAWDRVSYLKDPEAYTVLSVPSRAFSPAQPATGTPRLQRIGSNAVHMQQGESVTLQARTAPLMPVTFTSLDMGRFANQLTSQTVAADKGGMASVTFHAASGTLYDADIQAASPAASGVVQWIVRIAPNVAAFPVQENAAEQEKAVP